MKKLLAILICILMLVSLTACVSISYDERDNKDEDDKDTTATQKESDSDTDTTVTQKESDSDTDTAEPPSAEITELADESIAGSWTYISSYAEVCEETNGMTVDEYFENSLGVNSSDLGVDIDDYDTTMISKLIFNEDGTVTSTQDTSDLSEFNNDFYAAYTDYIKENPEAFAAIAGMSIEDIEAEAQRFGSTLDDYMDYICDTIIESSEATVEMLEVTSEGTYTINDNKITIEFVTEFTDYDPIESTETYELVDGALVGMRNDLMEMTFTKD